MLGVFTVFFKICKRRSYNGGSAAMDVEEESKVHERSYGGAGSLVLEVWGCRLQVAGESEGGERVTLTFKKF